MTGSSSKHVAEAGDPASSKPPAKQTTAAGEAAGNKPLTMRGRKRHKCTVCGNIARSRCPFFSCKGCCVKAGNSCHIHVLKPSPTGESPAATVPSQGPATSTIVRHPYDGLRLRTVRSSGLITKKEAGFINSWRFEKLRAHTEGITVSEDEAFDRYMQNVLLLEELFHVRYADGLEGHTPKAPLLMPGSSANEKSDGGINVAMVSAGLRVRQRSSLKKREAHKQKLKRAIDRSLQKLHKGEELDDAQDSEDFYLNALAARRDLKRMKVQSADGKERLRRMEVFSALIEKLKVVENQEDFDLCLKTYEENFVNHKTFSGRREVVSQMGASEQHSVSGAGNKESPKAPMDKSCAPDLTFNASFKSRLDSYGVMKQAWQVDIDAVNKCGHAFDVPLSSLERL
eukprot:c18981_g1_i1 orf=315-1511(-)